MIPVGNKKPGCSQKDVSRNSTDLSSNEKSIRFLQKLEDRRLLEVIERKRAKEELKSQETPEEKRARRLWEKKSKEIRRRERMGWDVEYQHYTNQDNPFGDAHLTSTFLWNKKLDKEGVKNVASDAFEVFHRRKQIENKIELEKVKKRRVERELERQSREDEVLLIQRSKEAAQFEEWKKQEDQFHLKQARLRSTVRIRDGRAKPIDLLAQYVSNDMYFEETIEMQIHEPYTVLNGLGVRDLEDLLADINVYIELEKGNNAEFWADMTEIVEYELQKFRKLEFSGENNVKVGRREGIHQSVAQDVTDVFRGKTALQLKEIGEQIETKILGKTDGIDVSYWESLLSQLKAHMARARLRDKHQIKLKEKLDLLKKSFSEVKSSEPKSNLTDYSQNHQADYQEKNEGNKFDGIPESSLEACSILYDSGSYSPNYISFQELDADISVISSLQADNAIEELRNSMSNKNLEESIFSQEEQLLKQDAGEGTNVYEADFSVETELEPQVYLWSDKYRPRKPRYFNRVHTGFEWNKYNQTHYDMDNPPPKIVQGYKFNIFYPDLIDKSFTPQYFLTPCCDNTDFSLLKFHAGPPYEDIAFKIVNREWEFSYKRGFRCQFHNNIFQLWFHFKRYRYRR